MSMYTHNVNYPRAQGNYSNRGGPRRNDNNRSYSRSHPNAQHSQLGAPPPIIQHVPRAQTLPGRVLLPTNQPLLMQPTPLTGPNARAPTVFPQNLGVVPPTIQQQLIAQNQAAGLPPFIFQQPQYATQQPINLALGNPPQIGATNTPQQISGGIHTMPPQVMASVNTATGTMNQVPPTSTTSYRGMSMPAPRPSAPQTKRQSKAIKIIDPNTNKEVSMGDSSKPETQQPSVTQPDATSSVNPQVTSGIAPTLTGPSTGPTTDSLVQDFKRRVHESNTTGAVNVQSTVTTTASSVAYKPPPPNAIITDPNNKVGEVSNKIGVSEVSSSKPRFDAEVSAQQPKSLLGSAPTSSTAQDQKFRDEFRQKVLQSVNQTTAVAEEEKEKVSQEMEVKNGSQEASIASQNVGENQKEALLPTPMPAAPITAPSPDESSETQVGEKSESVAPSVDVSATVPISAPATQATSNGSEQIETPPSETQADVQPVSAQPEKPESEETESKEVEDVSPPVPIAVLPSTEEESESVVKVEGVPETSLEEDTTQSIQADDTSSQITDSETPATVTAAAPVTEPQAERETVKLEKASEEKLKEEQVESSQPTRPVIQETSEVEPPRPENEVEEKPSTSRSEPEQKEMEPVKKAEAASAVPSSAVLVSESSVPAKVKEEVPTRELFPAVGGVSDASRTEVPESAKNEAKVIESKSAIADQQEPLLSSESVAQKKVNGEPKEPSPPKQVQQDEQSDAVPATKPVKREKPVDEAKGSPPAKPKEAVKSADGGKPEKQDKPASAKPVAAVPASAQLAPVLPEPPSAPQPSQNPYGRTMYQREFLLKFKEFCKDVPPELKTSDVFKLNAHQDHHIVPSGPPMGRDYQREYSRDRDYSRKGGRSRTDSRRGSNYQPVSKEPVDLHKAENRWTRPTKDVGEDGETVELFRKFQAILNKLTPQKFQNLAEQALKLKIDSEERLKGCIDKIFTKALEEPKFSIAYANLCKVMSTVKVEVPPETEGKPKVITFRRVLLTKCQQEFEKDKKDDEEREQKLNAIKETEDAEKKKQLEDELEACEVKNRKRSLGNIRFIGELFKLKMLSETIMHECVVRLLRSSSDEESLECFAGLITTTGKDLDHPEAKTRIDQYFSRIAEIIKKGKIPARIKFMLQDVQDLRDNNWVPRQRQEQSLKTIDQIHHEAKVEEEKEKQFVAQAFAAGSMKHGGGSRRGSTKPDDWAGGGKGDRDRDRGDRREKDRDRGERDRERDKPREKLDARKLQVLLKHREKKETGAPMLGPGSGLRPQQGTWGRGGAGASSAAQDSAKTDKDKRPSRTSSSGTKRSDKDKLPVGRGSGSSAKRAHSTPTPDSQNEKALAIQAVQQVTTKPQQPASQKQEQGPPKSRGEHRTSSHPAQDRMDESTVRRKTVTIVDELVQNKDFKEAIECVREMKSPGKMNFLVAETINHSLEQSSQHRQFAGKLFNKLVQGRHLSEAKFMEGLNEVLEFAEDIAIDIPKIWDYLGEILSPIVSQSTLSLSFLGSICPSLLSSGKAGVLAAKVLVHCRSQLPSDEEVTSLWNSASLEWSALGVASEDLGEFLSSNGLTYLQASSQPSSDSQPLEYVTELTYQCRAQDTTNEEIVTWIETNIPSPVLRKPEFVATVTAAVVNATVSDSGSSARFEEDKFQKRALLIKKYVERNKDLQLRVLYALQIAVAQLQHPPGLLYNMFNLIYDLEIVGEEEFRRWKDQGTENFGKGAAVTMVKNFFEWLDSGETESDNDT